MPLVRSSRPRRFSRPRRLALALCLIVLALVPGFIPAAVTRAGKADGARLLQAQLPAGLPLSRAGCEVLVRAVRAATLSHHQQAAAILSAALAADHARSCECVEQLFRAAVNAAPDHAKDLLETATADCPECADTLAATLGRLQDKNVVADPKDAAGDPGTGLSDRNLRGLGYSSGENGPGSDGGPGTDGGTGAGPGADPGMGFGRGTGPGIGLAGSDTGGFGDGFGGGLGASFPGAPGFGGSSPGGGFALPRPVASQVTVVVND